MTEGPRIEAEATGAWSGGTVWTDAIFSGGATRYVSDGGSMTTDVAAGATGATLRIYGLKESIVRTATLALTGATTLTATPIGGSQATKEPSALLAEVALNPGTTTVTVTNTSTSGFHVDYHTLEDNAAPAATGPYAQIVEDLVRGPHTQHVTARVVTPAGTITLDVDAAQTALVAWDETRAPRVTARLAVPAPADLADLGALDPRLGARLQIDAGYTLPDGTLDVHPLVDLGVRTARVDRPGDLLLLEAQSDEALILDEHHGSTGPITVDNAAGKAAALADLVTWFLRNNNPTPTILNAFAADTAYTNDQLGRAPWDAIDTLADTLDADVYDDGLRTWHITPRPVAAATTAHTLVPGQAGTLIETSKATSRGGTGPDGWYNAVDLIFRHRNAAGAETVVRGSATIGTGPFATTGAAGVRRYVEERDQVVTGAEAAAAAAAIVRRTVTRGSTLTVSAVAAYWLRAGHTVAVALPGDTGTTDHLVAGVEFDLAAGRMTLTTRAVETYTVS